MLHIKHIINRINISHTKIYSTITINPQSHVFIYQQCNAKRPTQRLNAMHEVPLISINSILGIRSCLHPVGPTMISARFHQHETRAWTSHNGVSTNALSPPQRQPMVLPWSSYNEAKLTNRSNPTRAHECSADHTMQ